MSSLKCTNPQCEQMMEYDEGAFQVICPHCNTWHLAPDQNSSSSPEEFKEEEFYIPEVDNVVPQEESLPQLIEEEAGEAVPVESKPEKISIGFIITETGEKFQLREGKNVIGRKDTDIVIQDKTISRRHCVIEVNQTDHGVEYFVFDIGHLEGEQSTNGVFISGRSLRLQDYERVPLLNGTMVKIGNVSFQMRSN